MKIDWVMCCGNLFSVVALIAVAVVFLPLLAVEMWTHATQFTLMDWQTIAELCGISILMVVGALGCLVCAWIFYTTSDVVKLRRKIGKR